MLVCPLWPSAHYWPMLINEYRNKVAGVLQLKGSKVLKHGHNSNSLLGSQDFKGDVVALYIDCS